MHIFRNFLSFRPIDIQIFAIFGSIGQTPYYIFWKFIYTIYYNQAIVDTKDKIFLLSANEAEKYFENDGERVENDSNRNPIWWWLRSPGDSNRNAADVSKHRGTATEKYKQEEAR